MTPREIEREARVLALEETAGRIGGGLKLGERICFEGGWVAALRWLGTLSTADVNDVLDLERGA